MNESYHTCKLHSLLHVSRLESHVTHMNESCHTYEWVISHMSVAQPTSRVALRESFNPNRIAISSLTLVSLFCMKPGKRDTLWRDSLLHDTWQKKLSFVRHPFARHSLAWHSFPWNMVKETLFCRDSLLHDTWQKRFRVWDRKKNKNEIWDWKLTLEEQ